MIPSGRIRSNLGAKVSRASYMYGGGTKSRASGERRVLLSAKKRARQITKLYAKDRCVPSLSSLYHLVRDKNKSRKSTSEVKIVSRDG